MMLLTKRNGGTAGLDKPIGIPIGPGKRELKMKSQVVSPFGLVCTCDGLQ